MQLLLYRGQRGAPSIPALSHYHSDNLAISHSRWAGINDRGHASWVSRAKNETRKTKRGNDHAESRRQIARRTDPLPAGQISDLFKPAPKYLGAYKENEWDCGGRRNAQGCFRGSWNTRSSPSLFLSFPPSPSLSFILFGLSLFLPALLFSLRLSRLTPSFRLSPNALFTPLSVLLNRNSAGRPTVLPWIYIASLRTPNILRRFDLRETFAKYFGLISAARRTAWN